MSMSASVLTDVSVCMFPIDRCQCVHVVRWKVQYTVRFKELQALSARLATPIDDIVRLNLDEQLSP